MEASHIVMEELSVAILQRKILPWSLLATNLPKAVILFQIHCNKKK